LFDFGINGLVSHSLVPIRAATILGTALFFFSLLVVVGVLILRFVKPGLQAPGATTIVILVTFFSGIQLLFFGLLGEYIGAIHSQVRKKPFVVVRETVNIDVKETARARLKQLEAAG
jgi:polyisoprenyl-phosphate glycosyltransferase